jgi:phosphopantothenoylcysteine decarboxylase/phosphopantothenate--cysteine ligase
VKVALAVTGCIGAYKAALVLRLLQQEGFEIVPVMTHSATQFLGALTLEKLSGRKVISDLFEGGSTEIEHISVAREIDLLLVAPATANILAKFANGIADDFLSTLYISTSAPVMVAPAMNVEMWNHLATQANLAVLKDRGVGVVEPGYGYQACGDLGEGRLAEPEKICDAVCRRLRIDKTLVSKKVLVTAGPTVEDIDPIRFISNRSSGKMGYALAAEALRRGAEVHLVSGPTSIEPPRGVAIIPVRSASEMAEAVLNEFEETDILIKSAAVADFTPVKAHSRKLKKQDQVWSLELVRTTDILEQIGRVKKQQFVVGFAAESEDLCENARRKLEKKSLDLIVANDISLPDSGFGADTNRVVMIDSQGQTEIPLLSKAEVAARIWDKIEELHSQRLSSLRPNPGGKS